MTISKTLSLAFLLGSAALPAAAQDYFISNAKLVTNSSDGIIEDADILIRSGNCLLYTSPSPRDKRQSRMPSSA